MKTRFLQKLLSLAGVTPKAASCPETPPLVNVPHGHHVTLYSPLNEPMLQRCHSQALIAHLGSASDEFEEELCAVETEIQTELSKVYPESGVSPRSVLLATDAHQISDAFAPNNPKVLLIPGLLLWVMDAGSAHLWLRNPDPLLQAIRRIGSYQFNGEQIRQFVTLVMKSQLAGLLQSIGIGNQRKPNLKPAPGSIELAQMLSDVASVGFVPQDGTFFIEVCRPDAVLGLLRIDPLEASTVRPSNATDEMKILMGDNPAKSIVARAPRLRRLTLDAIENPADETWNELMAELLRRDIGLLISCEESGKVSTRHWSNSFTGIPVFPDLISLLDSVEDMQKGSEPLSLNVNSPRMLYRWLDQQSVPGIALNVYKDRNTPLYLPLTKEQVSVLAQGRIPERRGTPSQERIA